ncbi:PQQ-binding-like beta-propeller repeat protein [Streptomyces sp. AA1529]|uniref:outer membrane protein assembly factor BamB family protein n=1 Tax=Streptomyces sp. AA1529 TaxID=1203257 RepID=UPI003D751EAB
MTQPPPPPPGQPPQGGWNPPAQPSPQQAPPPQHVPPRQIPQQPPVPQQPPAPPAAPPAPPPSGPGFGQAPYGGHPAAPQQPPPPPGGGGPFAPRGRSPRAVRIFAAVVAVVLVAGGIWLFSVGGEDGNGPRGSEAGVPGGSHAKQLFSLEQPDTHVKDAQGADGSWATEKIYAKSSINAIEGYRMNGERAWRIPLGGPVCAASPHMTDDHRTAVAFEKGSGGCNSVAVFDVDTGKKLWDQPIPIGRTIFGGGDVNLTVAQDTVALSWIGGFAAFPIGGGDPLWKSKETGETCEHSRYGGGARLLVVLECDESLTLNQLDPKTGHSTWDMRLPHNLKDGRAVRIVDTDPIVLVLGIGDASESEVMTIDDDGSIAATFSLGDRYEPGCGIGDLGSEACFNVVATEDMVYIATKEHSGKSDDSLSRTNEVMGFGFHSGEPKWKSGAGEGRTVFPIGTRGDKAIAYVTPADGKGGQVVSVSPGNGEQHGLLRLPDETAEQQSRFRVPTMSRSAPALYVGGRLFLQRSLLYGKNDTDAKEKAPLAMGFGTGR